ncbi:HSF-type DNA-binding-domain-containing protein, partial [Tribonema minus]
HVPAVAQGDQRFPIKLHQILERESPDIITWNEHGDAFIIKDEESFARDVLPKYFRHSNVKSFQRQCNYYNFGYRTIGDAFSYSHPHFKRGQDAGVARI